VRKGLAKYAKGCLKIQKHSFLAGQALQLVNCQIYTHIMVRYPWQKIRGGPCSLFVMSLSFINQRLEFRSIKHKKYFIFFFIVT